MKITTAQENLLREKQLEFAELTNIQNLEEAIKEQDKEFEDIFEPIAFPEPIYKKHLTPYKCPVCNGTMVVPSGFYLTVSGVYSSNSTTPETCKTCKGTGIVWG